ncbi:hypothetical protein TNCV_1353071 [Trichonephila clavipes]|nr:hypothetical protein TNCV_1353071 [Trichonephila clavipes]
MIPLTKEQQDVYDSSSHCYICSGSFTKEDWKVRDLCHLTEPAMYLQVDDHVHPGNCPAAVSSEKKQDLLHMEFLPSPAELGYERTDAVFFLQFLMNGVVI